MMDADGRIYDEKFCAMFQFDQIALYMKRGVLTHFLHSDRTPQCWQIMACYSVGQLSTTGSVE